MDTEYWLIGAGFAVGLWVMFFVGLFIGATAAWRDTQDEIRRQIERLERRNANGCRQTDGRLY